MTGLRFYLEPGGKNVVAVRVDDFHFERAVDEESGERKLVRVYEGYGRLFERPNSPVEETQTPATFLRECKVIGERRARVVHPALFDLLND